MKGILKNIAAASKAGISTPFITQTAKNFYYRTSFQLTTTSSLNRRACKLWFIKGTWHSNNSSKKLFSIHYSCHFPSSHTPDTDTYCNSWEKIGQVRNKKDN